MTTEITTATNAGTIDLSIDVPGTVEQVWRAISSGPGISSWYVPHVVEERAGGHAVASFGPGPEMQIPGRVAVWEPQQRIVFDGGEDAGGLSFEWTMVPRSPGITTVRLVNAGFGDGADAQAQIDGMEHGWRFFLLNLKMHLEHFAGRSATSALPMAQWSCAADRAWNTLLERTGLPTNTDQADSVTATFDETAVLRGTVGRQGERWLLLVLDEPAPGTALIATEGGDDACTVSVWSYLYGETGESAAGSLDQPIRDWLEANGPDGGGERGA